MGKRPSDHDLVAKDLIFDMAMGDGKRASDSDIAKARKAHQLRSPRARGIDESITSEITNSFEHWAGDPARLDMIGVDTKVSKKRGKRS